MVEAPKLTRARKAKIEGILTRALADIPFRESLMANPEKALAKEKLTPFELKMLSNLRRVGLEEWGVNVRKFRAFMRDNGNKVSDF